MTDTDLYVYVEDNQVVEGPKHIPTSWRNVSGLNNLSDEDLIEMGWLPVVDEHHLLDTTDRSLLQFIIGNEYVSVKYNHDAAEIENIRASVEQKIEQHAKQLRNQVVEQAPEEEMAGWWKKEQQARAYDSTGDPADAHDLQTEATNRGMALDKLVNKILTKANYFHDMEAKIAGVAGKHKDTIRQMNDSHAIAEYDYTTDWPTT